MDVAFKSISNEMQRSGSGSGSGSGSTNTEKK